MNLELVLLCVVQNQGTHTYAFFVHLSVQDYAYTSMKSRCTLLIFFSLLPCVYVSKSVRIYLPINTTKTYDAAIERKFCPYPFFTELTSKEGYGYRAVLLDYDV